MELIILFGVLIALMFFMSSRTRKQQKEQQAFRATLAPGQEVMTGSGMVGTVVAVDEAADTVTIESTPGVQTRWLRAAIAKRMDTPVAAEETDVTEQSAETGSITPADGSVDVPDDISGLDTAQREYREQKRREDGETEGK
ncbi:preprotein translocase subunit YajC [Isoptericola variabilis]|uniref:Preprotein translocase, YajC subunit n=1 Tax=Isoptericola variabilis (strain 225) TaxID=743718 RepID=F6FVH7_ISOV2|nr:preprotein translocase subunit YajC [Isoptericola variabilis]AEG44404.1 preprotein translocase, YajC subunit [Isoptericola variabilis 225]TWH34397.1 preprotein translocase subunit YajC [Isoptericola variabilis J7]